MARRLLPSGSSAPCSAWSAAPLAHGARDWRALRPRPPRDRAGAPEAPEAHRRGRALHAGLRCAPAPRGSACGSRAAREDGHVAGLPRRRLDRGWVRRPGGRRPIPWTGSLWPGAASSRPKQYETETSR